MSQQEESKIKSQLEKSLANEFGVGQVCLSSNGTHAIEVLLTALEIPRGAKVIVPEMTFMATATAVARCGLIPVLADIETDYLGLSLATIEAVYTPDVQAIVLVHLAGFVNRDFEAIQRFCNNKKIHLIEDCAQAHAAYFKNQRVGSLGTASTLSFQSSKLFNCGEGGAILSKDAHVVNQCKALSNWCWPGEGFGAQFDLPGSNYRLSYLQADQLLEQLAQAQQKINYLRGQYEAMASMALTKKLKFLPASFAGDFVDSPFFFMVTNTQANHQLEPRSQYPLSQSSVVQAILKRWFPDLLNEFIHCNRDAEIKRPNSFWVKKTYSFLRISQFDSMTDFEQTLNQLQGNN